MAHTKQTARRPRDSGAGSLAARAGIRPLQRTGPRTSLTAALQGLAQVQEHIEAATAEHSNVTDQERIRQLEAINETQEQELAANDERIVDLSDAVRRYRAERDTARSSEARLKEENKELKEKLEQVKKQLSGVVDVLDKKSGRSARGRPESGRFAGLG